jgi:hypothetical protein
LYSYWSGAMRAMRPGEWIVSPEKITVPSAVASA